MICDSVKAVLLDEELKSLCLQGTPEWGGTVSRTEGKLGDMKPSRAPYICDQAFLSFDRPLISENQKVCRRPLTLERAVTRSGHPRSALTRTQQ